MSPETRQSLKSPWMILGLFLVGGTILGLILFVGQVIRYVRAIDAGGPNPFQQDQRRLVVQRLLAQPSVEAALLTRLDPRGNQHPIQGNPMASIRIVEFVDYECPFCRATATPLREFMRRHAEDVALVIRDFPLEDIHPGAFEASLAARCVFRQGKMDQFWRYHDRLFRETDGLSRDDLRAAAIDVGVDIRSFDGCLDGRLTEVEVNASRSLGLEAGVRGTPTFFMNGKKIQGSLDLETLEELYGSLKKSL